MVLSILLALAHGDECAEMTDWVAVVRFYVTLAPLIAKQVLKVWTFEFR